MKHRQWKKSFTDSCEEDNQVFQKSETEIKALIKAHHPLHKFKKALALTGDTLKKYIADNKDLQKALEDS